jgi:hypothetical protein
MVYTMSGIWSRYVTSLAPHKDGNFMTWKLTCEPCYPLTSVVRMLISTDKQPSPSQHAKKRVTLCKCLPTLPRYGMCMFDKG